jgi:hypothetical protein
MSTYTCCEGEVVEAKLTRVAVGDFWDIKVRWDGEFSRATTLEVADGVPAPLIGSRVSVVLWVDD